MVTRASDTTGQTGLAGRSPEPSGARRLLRRLRWRRELDVGSLDRYVIALPSMQNAIDAIPGWVCAMPPETGLKAGEAFLYADTRLSWLIHQRYDVSGKSVLELGPLEGLHTYMLHEAGAAGIDAIEANALAYMRCLVTKETLGLARARFLLGDFMPWLETRTATYDLVVASGVLYHSQDPVRLLDLITQRTEAIFLWTHYFDEGLMPRGDGRRGPFSGRVETRNCRGVSLRVHERRYFKAWRDPKFCGGTHDRHFWLEREGILSLLKAAGFTSIVIADEEPQHIGGPAFSVFATRETPASDADGEASDVAAQDVGQQDVDAAAEIVEDDVDAPKPVAVDAPG